MSILKYEIVGIPIYAIIFFIIVLVAFSALIFQRGSQRLRPVFSIYTEIVDFVFKRNPSLNYANYEKLSQGISYLIVSLLAAFTSPKVVAIAAAFAFGNAFVASSLVTRRQVDIAMDSHHEQAIALENAADDIESLQKQLDKSADAMRLSIERSLASKSKFSDNQRVTVWAKLESTYTREHFYQLVARYSHHPDYRRGFWNKMECSFGVCWVGHNSPRGDFWEMPEYEDEDEAYEHIWGKYKVRPDLVRSIHMFCETICIHQIVVDTYPIGLIVVESQDKELEEMTKIVNRLQSDPQIRSQINDYITNFMLPSQPISMAELWAFEELQ